MSLEQEILEVVRQLNEDQQRKALEYVRSLKRPAGVSGRSLLKHAGSIPSDDIEQMKEAIKDLEQVNLDEW